MNNIKRMRNERGFTLIELLVVIVILGILAAVVVFAVGGLTDKGEESSCRIDTRTLRTAEEAYFAKTGNYGEMDDLTTSPDKFLAEASTLHDVELVATNTDTDTDGAGPDTDTDGPTDPDGDFKVVVTQAGIDKKCAPEGTAPGTEVDGEDIQ